MDATAAERPPAKFTPLPRQLTASQLEDIFALPRHEESPAPTDEASRPARIYTCPERFAQEQAHIFKRLPVVAAPSCSIREPGSYMALDALGPPVLLTRDVKGKAHAFVNACRHRGAKLVGDCAAHKGGRVSCPYHAWTYALDGKLVGIPRAETFPTADKASLGLVELPSAESGGLIWIGLDRQRKFELLPHADDIDADLRALGMGDMHLYGQRYYELKSNWKLVIEPFLEPYHVQRLHAATVANLNADTHPITRWFGSHVRQIAGKVHFTPESNELTSDRLHKTITHSYVLFPNTIIVTSPYFISVMVAMPQAVDRTIVQYSMLMPQPIRDAMGEDLFKRSYAFQHEIFSEDFSAGVSQQEGLRGGAIETIYFGGMERTIGPFHDVVESFLPAGAR